jgi:hypothetical protein
MKNKVTLLAGQHFIGDPCCATEDGKIHIGHIMIDTNPLDEDPCDEADRLYSEGINDE